MNVFVIWTRTRSERRVGTIRADKPKTQKTVKVAGKRDTHLAKQMDLFVPDIKRYFNGETIARSEEEATGTLIAVRSGDGRRRSYSNYSTAARTRQEVARRAKSSATTVVI